MPDHRDPELDVVRVFLRDFVLPVRIGAFAYEKEGPQKVRFDITVEVARASGGPKSLDDILSYDLIREIVVATAGEGHTEFAETLAEQIARRILREPHAKRVNVQVEKLEMGPGRVGVEVVMTRPA